MKLISTSRFERLMQAEIYQFMEKPSPEVVKGIFDQYYHAELSLWTEFTKYMKVRSFRRGEIIKDYYKTEKHINILISGSVAHFVSAEGKDVCISLYYENQIFSEYLSFLTQSESAIKTESLENSVIWSISHQDLKALYLKSTKGLLIAKAIADAMFIRKQMEQINLLTLSPIERYVKLLRDRPEILQRTSLKIIASYLGVTAESLSRIRKKVL
ncbi:MAG: Crp/Fnr family transcriptional regulator [Arcticibacter sp.]